MGGGHAGVEAALASARMGADTLLLTQNIETIGQMSCNPAIGGIGKSHLVKEIDALGGVMARAADAAGIHFRTLNASKGPAVQATRAQADRQLYKQAIREACENQANLSIHQQSVHDLLWDGDRVVGVITELGLAIQSRAVILTVGTFLAGTIHVGKQHHPGGRAGDRAATELAHRLRESGLQVGRLKTGTPPRIDGRSIDYSVLQVQPSERPLPSFSFMGGSQHPTQVDCHIAHTNAKCHDIIREHMHESAIHSGDITGLGPRYCPSIEDKVHRFAEREQHQVFVEPEGLHTHEIYPNGISTSLPFDVQVRFVQAMKGFEKAHITRPGYAIEYDFFDPRGLTPWLACKNIEGLFMAGQINGTTGYEEAAAQGLLAGINAVRMVRAQDPWYPRRDQAYIGVLVDDLVTLGTSEPYRMFTSRAEWRLLLRQDNADWRLTEIGKDLGLVNAARWMAFSTKRSAVLAEQKRLQKTVVQPEGAHRDAVNACLEHPLASPTSLHDLLKRPSVRYQQLLEAVGLEVPSEDVAEQVAIQARYEGYIARQADEVKKLQAHEGMAIPVNFDYRQVGGLSAELMEKCEKVRPVTLGQAGRIPGMTPAALALLVVYVKRG